MAKIQFLPALLALNVGVVAFLVIREGTTRVLPVAMPPMTTLDRVVEMMPDLVDKVEKYFDKKEEKEPV
jgi:uncharacterized spore protein YtfJ